LKEHDPGSHGGSNSLLNPHRLKISKSVDGIKNHKDFEGEFAFYDIPDVVLNPTHEKLDNFAQNQQAVIICSYATLRPEIFTSWASIFAIHNRCL
jgi:hypothetical protein